MTAQRRMPVVWLALAVLTATAVLGGAAWRISLHALDEQIAEKRSAIKRLTVSEGIAPNEKVHSHLKERDGALKNAYYYWLERVVAGDLAESSNADLQLYFQEQLHDVQRNIDRLAAGRKVASPEMVGLPKELPPTETVARLLAQLQLAESAATIVYEQGAIELLMIKIEDPEPVANQESRRVLLTRVPLRLRLNCSLAQLMRLMQALGSAKPLVDVRALRIISGTQAERLDVELQLARYLATTQLDALLDEEEDADDRTPK